MVNMIEHHGALLLVTFVSVAPLFLPINESRGVLTGEDDQTADGSERATNHQGIGGPCGKGLFDAVDDINEDQQAEDG